MGQKLSLRFSLNCAYILFSIRTSGLMLLCFVDTVFENNYFSR